MSMLTEIHEQPDMLARLLAANERRLPELGLLARGVTHVVVAARGTSDNAARYAQYIWGARNGLTVGLTTPSLFGALDAPPSLEGALVVGISQSGQSPDLISVLGEARRQGCPTLAITNDANSPLAEQASLIIDLCAGPERAVAATKTYTLELAAVALCSLAFAQLSPRALAGLPGLVDDVLDTSHYGLEAVSLLLDRDWCVVLARGFQLASAFEWALKLQELTYLVAQPFSAAEFLHGPVAVVEPGVPVLIVATSGPTYHEMVTVAKDMLSRGARVIALTDTDDTPAHTRLMTTTVAPWLSPIVAAPVLQLFTHALACARGLDPDQPRGLSKVTLTS